MAEVPAPKPAAAIPEIPATSATAPMPSHAPRESAKGSEVPWYALALLLGAISGFAEVAVGDLMLTGFLALFFCMLMGALRPGRPDRKSTRLNSSHPSISYAVFCLKKKKINN